ncbi:MAG: fimbria/pilus periplasmic chaperone [Myxococcota bacterium]
MIRPALVQLAILSALAAVLVCAEPAPAEATPGGGGGGIGGITLVPTRIVLEGNVRSAEVLVQNSGRTPATMRVSLVHTRMTPAGVVEQVDSPTPTDLLSESLLRLSPKQVLVEPGKAQRIRLIVRKPAGLPEGEYRVNLLVQQIPTITKTTGNLPAGKVGLQVVAIPAISIPVIVRHGKLTATASLSDVRIEQKPKKPAEIVVKLHRSGNRSVYGDLVATFQPAKSRKVVDAGLIRGIAVYVPLEARQVSIHINPEALPQLHGGRLRLTFNLPADQGGAQLAETTVALP